MKRDAASRPGRWKGIRRAIVDRYEDTGSVITGMGVLHGHWFMVRKLSCGHEMREPSGGRAKYAQFALCRQCAKEMP